jgi:hypothetical protein
MANAARAMKGPTKIIELDGIPSSKWKVDPNALHLWKGKLWVKEKVGCVLCVEKEGNDHITFSCESDNGTQFYCMEHGELAEVPYTMKKTYVIRIGDVVRDGEESLEDTMLFPSNMDLAARNALIEKMLDEGQQEEKDAGPAPSDVDE